jgi:CubicO group peptidase (beta-lactamase class C family)
MAKFMAAAIAAACVILSWAVAVAKEPFIAPKTLDELDGRIAATIRDSKVVGVQVALVDREGASWAAAYGHLDKEKTRPATNEAIFRAGSISKSFTGVLAQMLVEDGALDLNARLADAVPAIAFQNKWEATDPVRLVHLAEHTSGWDDIHFSEYRSFAPDITLLEGLAVNPKSRTSRWRPGRYGSYCNAGPSALAAAMEAATGRRYENLIDERIFAPLGIARASFLLTPDVAGDLSKSYAPLGEEEPYTHIGMRPAGSLNISASELAKFVAFLIRRGEAGGVQLGAGRRCAHRNSDDVARGPRRPEARLRTGRLRLQH